MSLKINCSNEAISPIIFKDIPLNTPLLISSYLVIITVFICLQQRNFKSLIWVLAAIITLQLSAIVTKHKVQNQAEFVVLNTSKNTLLIERHGSNIRLYANISIMKNIKNNKLLTSYLTANFSTLIGKQNLKNLMYFEGKKILLIDSSKAYPKNVQPDLLIITQSPKINFERLLQTMKPKIVIADASNYKSMITKWQATCSQQKIPFHATREKGFYKIN